MDNLIQKIEKTRLFTDPVKLRLLTHLQEISEADRSNLEATIDQFDRQMDEAVQKLRSQIGQHVTQLRSEATTPEEEEHASIAAKAIWDGLDVMTASVQ